MWLSKALIVFSLIKVSLVFLLLIFAFPGAADSDTILPVLIRLLMLVLFVSIGGFMLSLDRGKSSVHLAAAFFLIASAYSNLIHLAPSAQSVAQFESLLSAGNHLTFDAFLAYEVWAFLLAFTQSSHRAYNKLLNLLKEVGLVTGVVIFSANLLALLGFELTWMEALLIHRGNSFYELWVYLPVSLFPILVCAAYWLVPVGNKPQILTFLLAMSCSFPALLIILISSLSPAFNAYITTEGPASIYLTLANILLFFVPLIAAYAVVVTGARANESLTNLTLYRFANGLVYLFLSVPVMGFCWYLFTMRHIRLGAVFGEPGALMLFFCAVGFLVLFKQRVKLVEEIVERFHRRPYKVDEVLRREERLCATSESFPSLLHDTAELLRVSLSLAKVGVLISTSEDNRYQSMNFQQDGKFVVLSDTEKAALRDDKPVAGNGGDYAWLLPLAGRLGQVIGLLAVGYKSNDDDFSSHDHKLLREMHHLLSVTTARLILDTAHEEHRFLAQFEAARECGTCGMLYESTERDCKQCSISLVIAPIPMTLNEKYVMKNCIGSGSFGKVYHAVDITIDRQVAIKAMPTMHDSAAQVVLKKEARLMAKMAHQNVAILFGLEFWYDVPLLIVEYVGGGTLDLLIDKLELDQRKTLAIQLCRAIGFMHARGVLHLDLKPENIAFSKENEVKVLDFGTAHLAKSLAMIGEAELPLNMSMQQARQSTISGRLVGTPLYMSPEALTGQAPDHSFDLWSLSVVLVELMTGRHPFSYASWAESFFAISRCRPLLDHLNADAQINVGKLFAISPEDRPSSVDDIKKLLTMEVFV